MSQSALARFGIYCVTEGVVVETDFRDIDSPPTVCPNNNTHTVDTNRVNVIETFKTESIFLNQGAEGTQGIYTTNGTILNIPIGGGAYTHDVSMPYRVSPRVLHVYPNADNIGDTVTFVVAPNTKMSELSANEIIGATTLHVDPGTASTFLLGMEIHVDDGVNDQNLGKCIDKDIVNDTITVENALTNNYNIGTDVQQSYIRIEDIPIANTNNFTIGGSKFYSDSVAPNTTIRLIYNNNGISAKKFHYCIEMFI